MKKKIVNKIVDYLVLLLVVLGLFLFIKNSLNTKVIIDYFPYIFNGLGVTLLLAFLSSIFGSILGIIFAVMKNSQVDIFHKFVDAYVDLFRGTPLLVQLSILYFGLVQFGINLPSLVAATITFSLNSAAYVSEIIRSGINSINYGQVEAARALGVKEGDIYKNIILPIAIRNILPSLVNEFITLVKETSIVSVIGVADLMRRYSIVKTQTYLAFEPLITIAIIYYVVVKILTKISRKIEVKLKYD